jgi:hypothetical protein
MRRFVVVVVLAACAERAPAPGPGLTLELADPARGLAGVYRAADGTLLEFAATRDDRGRVAVAVREGERVIAEVAPDGAGGARVIHGDGAAYGELVREVARAAGGDPELGPFSSALAIPRLAAVAEEEAPCGTDGYIAFVDASGETGGEACACPVAEDVELEVIFHHPDNCRGECGPGCDGIGGLHFCTAACMAHDNCVRGLIDAGLPAWAAHACCSFGLKAAAESYLACLLVPSACECPGPH